MRSIDMICFTRQRAQGAWSKRSSGQGDKHFLHCGSIWGFMGPAVEVPHPQKPAPADHSGGHTGIQKVQIESVPAR